VRHVLDLGKAGGIPDVDGCGIELAKTCENCAMFIVVQQPIRNRSTVAAGALHACFEL